MTPKTADVERVVGFVWETLAGIPVEAAAFEEPEGARVAAIVPFSGGEGGWLLLECSVPLARAAAGRMFAEPEALIGIDRAQEAAAELLNVLAGNLKSLTPGDCALGIPATRVLEAGEPSPAGRGGCRMGFRAGSERVLVTFRPGGQTWKGARS